MPSNVEGLELRGEDNRSGIGNNLNNLIKGNAGDNLIDGLGGKDVLTGLGGRDTFQFSSKPTSFTLSAADRITDFNSNEDLISISKSSFGLASTSAVSFRTIGNSASLSSALASNEIFIYDSSSGSLYCNQNGQLAGAGSGGLFAILDTKPTLTTANFILY